jgi:hypothetical protein
MQAHLAAFAYTILIFPSRTCCKNSFCCSKVMPTILADNFSLIALKKETVSKVFFSLQGLKILAVCEYQLTGSLILD